VPQTQQPDIFWTAIDWAVKGAGALLLLILSVGWKDYRERIKKISELELQIEVLKAEVRNIKEWRNV
jgi:hypothetical protein